MDPTNLRLRGMKVATHVQNCFEKRDPGCPAHTGPSREVFPQVQPSRHSEATVTMVQRGKTNAQTGSCLCIIHMVLVRQNARIIGSWRLPPRFFFFIFLLLFICAYKAWFISPPCPHPLPYHPLDFFFFFFFFCDSVSFIFIFFSTQI
jgi:hypothetical protein